jgi:hypothetical protein
MRQSRFLPFVDPQRAIRRVESTLAARTRNLAARRPGCCRLCRKEFASVVGGLDQHFFWRHTEVLRAWNARDRLAREMIGTHGK